MLAIDFGLNGLPRSLPKPCAANSAEIDLSVNPCPFYVMTPKWPIGVTRQTRSWRTKPSW
jgi:hypothetical protein